MNTKPYNVSFVELGCIFQIFLAVLMYSFANGEENVTPFFDRCTLVCIELKGCAEVLYGPPF